MNITSYLFKQIDNTSLVLFRVLFGLLITLEAWGAIATGWVTHVLVEPKFTFNFLGFDFLQYLQGPYMYLHFFIMGIFGIGVMLGYKYKWSMLGYTIFWACAYFMQKTSYNNHYYLLLLICVFMLIVPAHRYLSMDVKRESGISSISMPNWVRLFIILQLWVVYTYASVAKFYPDWLDGTFPRILMSSKQHYYVIGNFLQTDFAITSIIYVGILFDLLVIPLLLWKKTRLFIFVFGIFFHLFNSIVFQIGIFPYLSLAFCLFFFDPKTINRKFLSKKPFFEEDAQPNLQLSPYKNMMVLFFIVWFLLQIILPVRNHFIQGDVLWTDEAHKLSWRMMLRTKNALVKFKVVDKQTGKKEWINTSDYLTNKQHKNLSRADGIWQFAQHLKKEYAKEAKEIEVYADAKLSVNGRSYSRFISFEEDLANAKFEYFTTNTWILPLPVGFYSSKNLDSFKSPN